ncbi:MAG: Bax inhibitor-1/YccA family protein, partial [Coprobacillus sp.]
QLSFSKLAASTTGISKFSIFMMNPMVRKLDKVEEHADHHATYGGVIRKTLFLLVLTLAGAVVFFATNSLAPTSYNYVVEGYTVNLFEAGIVGGSLLLTLLFPIITFKFVRTSMVLGSLYSLAQGYALAFVCHVFGGEYTYPVALAFLLTLIIVATMLIIYRMRLININKKFMSIVATLFFTMVICSVLVFVSGMFPQTRFIYDLIMENSILAIASSVIGIIIVCLFLLVDFEVINHCVKDQLPKKYEWLAAFALSFSIIELYLKILNLILRITQKSKS